ncbi:hypothetical protein TGPRC2_427550, partial [Toxoplasma gondii TgCatPRC2]
CGTCMNRCISWITLCETTACRGGCNSAMHDLTKSARTHLMTCVSYGGYSDSSRYTGLQLPALVLWRPKEWRLQGKLRLRKGPGPPIPGVDPPQVVPGHLAQGPGAGPPQLGPGAAAAGQGPPLPGQGPPFPAQGPHPPRGHPPGPPQPGQNVFGLRPPRSPGSFNR